MERVEVHIAGESALRHYPVIIGQHLLEKISSLIDLAPFSKVLTVIDRNISARMRPRLDPSLSSRGPLIEIDAGESAKNLYSLEQLWQRFLAEGADRQTLILNVGGGVLGDLSGFAASTYMRGVPFIQIPTTLLAQVDASVGGKVAVNLGSVKNIVGSFQQPRAVLIDTETLTSLPVRDLVSGAAELIKHGLIFDYEFFLDLSRKSISDLTPTALVPIIKRSVEIKSSVVAGDERESGIRKILNFGHTVGHALEATALETTDPLLHGEAVSIGMVAEAWLSCQMGYISQESLTQIEAALTRFTLPVRLPRPLSAEKLQRRIGQDKKNHHGTVQWVLLREPGRAAFDCKVPDHLVSSCLGYISHE